MNYPSIRIEGAILSPDILEHLVDGAKGQGPKDFGLDSGTKVKDEIARAWADAQDYWRIFQRKLETVKEGTAATTETRQNWIIPLLGLLRYEIEFQKSGTEKHGKNYPISHRVTNRANTPLHIVGYNDAAGLDRKGSQRMSAHALIQQYLNLADELYGVVTNGRVIRLLRDSSRLVKQSYLEFDLDRIFNDGLFADFAILFRLIHATRLPATDAEPKDSLLETYHQDSLDSGARIRDGLSKAVENAILDFGNGFLANPANERLRTEIAEGRLTPAEYYRSLLQLIYRLLFLMVIEERDLVFPPDVPKAKRDVYRQYYSVQRIRMLAEKRYLADKRHHDLWMALVSTFRLFEADGPGEKLGIKPLAGDLFSPAAIAPIFDARLGNDVLLGCLRSLGLYEHPDSKQLIRVNYAALNVEEFGSVYEGLLEYESVFNLSGRVPQFGFLQGDERSRTGSHYTPDELVQPLIKHSLDYLIEDCVSSPHVSKGSAYGETTQDNRTAEQRLLDLRVADIACGSGHILLAAARRIATEVAIVRTGEEQPSPTAYRKALRDVIRNCIYGVDLNPLAVELCKVALWLEAHNPGEPLGFLDHHIKCGNAIVGFVSREEVDNGVPDEAFARMPGDDADFVKAVRNKNKAERRERRQQSLKFTDERRGEIDKVLEKWRAITAMPERTPSEIEAKKVAFERFSTSGAAYTLEQLASMPIAQFFIPKTPENSTKLMTDGEFRDYWSGDRRPQGQSTAMSDAVANENRFFHWFLEFPGVMERGGFDCILGNPPYLGGTDLSGTYGYSFCHFMKWEYSPAGLSDLVVYFLRRIFSLVRPNGFTSFITTNSIKDGDIRKDGLQQVLENGAEINMAVRGVKWPGRANLVISLVAIHRGIWKGHRSLDGKSEPWINSYLEPESEGKEPFPLPENADLIYEGWKPLDNDGFILSFEEADRQFQQPSNRDVIFPYLNGQELNNDPEQRPGRAIINFRDWPRDKAQRYEGPFSVVEAKVKPYRATVNRAVQRERWWIYGEHRPGLTRKLAPLDRCFIAAATTKHLNFSRARTDLIFSHAIKVFTTDRWDLYSVVQSTLHEVWARKYSGALKQDLRYSPSNCFETFAFPGDIWNEDDSELAEIGEGYHEHRKQLMLMLWLGLTKIYNLFHDPDLSVEMVADESGKDEDIAREGYEGLLELRRLHVEMDNAVRDAYGWQDLDLGHGFHEVETLPENDRIRYTISPTARKEVLKRLLALNHQRAAEEKAQADAAKPVKKKGGKKSKPDPATDGDNPLLSAGQLFD